MRLKVLGSCLVSLSLLPCLSGLNCNNNPTSVTVLPTVGFVTSGDEGDTATRQVVDWSAGPATINIGLTAVAKSNITIPITVMSSSTANNPADYTINTTSPVITAGDSVDSIRVSVKPGTSYQTFKTVILTIGQSSSAKLGRYLFDTVYIVDAQGFGAIYKLAENDVQGWKPDPNSPAPFAVFTGNELYTRLDGGAGTYLLIGGGLVNVYQDLVGPPEDGGTDPTMCSPLVAMDCGTTANAERMFNYWKENSGASVAIPGYDATVAIGYPGLGGNQTVYAHFKTVYFELVLGGYLSIDQSSAAAALILKNLEAKTH